MGRAVQLQEHQMMQEREQEYNQALDHSMDQQRLQVFMCSDLAVAGDIVTSALLPKYYIALMQQVRRTRLD